MRGAAPYVGAYCIRPTNGPDRGQVRRKRSRGEAPYVGRIAYAPQTIREDRMIESECPYLFPFGIIREAYAIRPYSLPEEKAAPTYIFRRIKERNGERR